MIPPTLSLPDRFLFMNAKTCYLLYKLAIYTMCALLLPCSAATAGIIFINFDDVPPGNDSGTRYLPLGVRFFVGNAAQGLSTAIRTDSNGNPITGRISNFGTSVSSPNVLVPAGGSNDDLWVQFYNTTDQTRTFASYASIQNDAEGFPQIYMEAFNQAGNSIARTNLLGPGVYGAISHPDIWLIKFYGQPGSLGNIGVDNFSFELQSTAVPEPSAGGFALLLAACAGLIHRRRFSATALLTRTAPSNPHAT